MVVKSCRKKLKALRRFKLPTVVAAGLFLVTSLMVYAGYMANDKVAVNPSAFQPLLQLIAQAESSDNYNAYFSNAGNDTINFTNMTIAEVLAWQKVFVQQGNASSAVGRYQIISPTLKSLVREMDLDTAQKFDKPMQDRMAMTLLERRGAAEFVNDKLSREEFAAQLAKEWAALPKVIGDNPHESYYASDGLNRSLVSVGEILAVIDKTNNKI